MLLQLGGDDGDYDLYYYKKYQENADGVPDVVGPTAITAVRGQVLLPEGEDWDEDDILVMWAYPQEQSRRKLFDFEDVPDSTATVRLGAASEACSSMNADDASNSDVAFAEIASHTDGGSMLQVFLPVHFDYNANRDEDAGTFTSGSVFFGSTECGKCTFFPEGTIDCDSSEIIADMATHEATNHPTTSDWDGGETYTEAPTKTWHKHWKYDESILVGSYIFSVGGSNEFCGGDANNYIIRLDLNLADNDAPSFQCAFTKSEDEGSSSADYADDALHYSTEIEYAAVIQSEGLDWDGSGPGVLTHTETHRRTIRAIFPKYVDAEAELGEIYGEPITEAFTQVRFENNDEDSDEWDMLGWTTDLHQVEVTLRTQYPYVIEDVYLIREKDVVYWTPLTVLFPVLTDWVSTAIELCIASDGEALSICNMDPCISGGSCSMPCGAGFEWFLEDFVGDKDVDITVWFDSIFGASWYSGAMYYLLNCQLNSNLGQYSFETPEWCEIIEGGGGSSDNVLTDDSDNIFIDLFTMLVAEVPQAYTCQCILFSGGECQEWPEECNSFLYFLVNDWFHMEDQSDASADSCENSHGEGDACESKWAVSNLIAPGFYFTGECNEEEVYNVLVIFNCVGNHGDNFNCEELNNNYGGWVSFTASVNYCPNLEFEITAGDVDAELTAFNALESADTYAEGEDDYTVPAAETNSFAYLQTIYFEMDVKELTGADVVLHRFKMIDTDCGYSYDFSDDCEVEYNIIEHDVQTTDDYTYDLTVSEHEAYLKVLKEFNKGVNPDSIIFRIQVNQFTFPNYPMWNYGDGDVQTGAVNNYVAWCEVENNGFRRQLRMAISGRSLEESVSAQTAVSVSGGTFTEGEGQQDQAAGSSSSSGFDYLPVVGGACAVLVVVAAVGVAITARQRRRSQAEKNAAVDQEAGRVAVHATDEE